MEDRTDIKVTPIQDAGDPVAEQPGALERSGQPKPPLPLDVLVAIADAERKVKLLLGGCLRLPYFPYTVLISDQATDALRAGVSETFRQRMEYYVAQPHFCREWLDEVADETVAATVKLAPDWSTSDYWGGAQSVRKELRDILQVLIEAQLKRTNDTDKPKSGTSDKMARSRPGYGESLGPPHHKAL